MIVKHRCQEKEVTGSSEMQDKNRHSERESCVLLHKVDYLSRVLNSLFILFFYFDLIYLHQVFHSREEEKHMKKLDSIRMKMEKV